MDFRKFIPFVNKESLQSGLRAEVLPYWDIDDLVQKSAELKQIKADIQELDILIKRQSQLLRLVPNKDDIAKLEESRKLLRGLKANHPNIDGDITKLEAEINKRSAGNK